MLTATIRTADGECIGILVLKPKTFSSGRQGYFGTGKIEIDGERHQCQAQAVKIGEPGKDVSDE